VQKISNKKSPIATETAVTHLHLTSPQHPVLQWRRLCKFIYHCRKQL